MKNFNIFNRRYLGNKQKVLPVLASVIKEHCHGCTTFLDIFSGTGSVSAYFNTQFAVTTNDLLFHNYISHQAFLGWQAIDTPFLLSILDYYNNLPIDLPNGYYTINFSDTYLSKENLQKVDYIRDHIDSLSNNGSLNKREKAVLLTSLLYAVDKIANTVGHYDAFRKNGSLDVPLVLAMPNVPEITVNNNNQQYNQDANQLIEFLTTDILYIDPPYNSRQYSDLYHFLENIATNKQPLVAGVAKKFDRSHLKSQYCTVSAENYLADLVDKAKARYILLSYNSTQDRADSRSNAKISDTALWTILNKKGQVKMVETPYSSFTTGKTKPLELSERIFVCENLNY